MVVFLLHFFQLLLTQCWAASLPLQKSCKFSTLAQICKQLCMYWPLFPHSIRLSLARRHLQGQSLSSAQTGNHLELKIYLYPVTRCSDLLWILPEDDLATHWAWQFRTPYLSSIDTATPYYSYNHFSLSPIKDSLNVFTICLISFLWSFLSWHKAVCANRLTNTYLWGRKLFCFLQADKADIWYQTTWA